VGHLDRTGAWAVEMGFEPPHSPNLSGQEAFLDYVLQMNAGFAMRKMQKAINGARSSWGKARAAVRVWRWWATRMVPRGKPWDLKLAADEDYRLIKYIPFHGSTISPEDFGNVLFGYTGRSLGIPGVVLINGSMGAHVRAYWRTALRPTGLRKLWDEYRDEYWIMRGVRLTKKLKPVGRYNGDYWIQKS